jgi:hypothetical protein
MTTQQAYEKINAYFSAPGAELAQLDVIPEGVISNCFYRRTVHGRIRKCAIGCIIPKHLYKPDMEGMGILQAFDSFPAIEEYFNGVRNNFLLVTQNAHDDAASVSDFLYELNRIADNFDLVLVKS